MCYLAGPTSSYPSALPGVGGKMCIVDMCKMLLGCAHIRLGRVHPEFVNTLVIGAITVWHRLKHVRSRESEAAISGI